MIGVLVSEADQSALVIIGVLRLGSLEATWNCLVTRMPVIVILRLGSDSEADSESGSELSHDDLPVRSGKRSGIVSS